MAGRSYPSKQVKILKRKYGGFGFRISSRPTYPHVVISDVIPGGSADLTKKIHVGDVLVRIEDYDLTHCSYDEGRALLKECPADRMVSMVVQRMGYAGFGAEERTQMAGSPREPFQQRSRKPFTFGESLPPILGHDRNSYYGQPRHEQNGYYGPPRQEQNGYYRQPRQDQDGFYGPSRQDQRGFHGPPRQEQNGSPRQQRYISPDRQKRTSPERQRQDSYGHSYQNGYSRHQENSYDYPDENDENDRYEHGQQKSNVGGPTATRISRKEKKEPKTEAHDDLKSKAHDMKNAKQSIELLNWDSGDRVTDTLHKTAKSYTMCTDDRCVGSMMRPAYSVASRKPGVPRPKDELLDQAEDFIKQYYESLNKLNSSEHKDRWAKVKQSIDKSGTYHITKEELVFGARTAWRNAPRCINRIQWNRLEIFDARHAKTARDMYDAICHHLEWSTNGGNIRTAITVFPPRTDGLHDYFVWSPQLIRYAGYRQEDGRTLGDPASLDITDICIKLGWQGKGTQFDILPLVLSANGGKPEVFDLPKEVCLEVPLKHPSFPWFEELGYRWYALPAVSMMMFDCGGLEFPAAPFSGWYMQTEVAARDLCDAARYNITETVAKKMGLNTNTNSSLWKDKACLEVNLAVLHSYQAAGVTIVEHHTTSETFIQHLEQEQRKRGGTPGDWVWVVPPISGSLCPVFHQEMLCYYLKPSYEYQPEPWKFPTYAKEWGSIHPDRNFKMKSVAHGMIFANRLIKKMLSKRIACIILYATETGKSEKFAKTACHVFRHAFDAKVICMEDYNPTRLSSESIILLVTSTFGDGEPPENGRGFQHELNEMRKGNNASRLLERTSYSVFALGSTAYSTYCEFGHELDEMFSSMGSKNIQSLVEGDELTGQVQSFKLWLKGAFQEAMKAFRITDPTGEVMKQATATLAEDEPDWNPARFKLEWVLTDAVFNPCDPLSDMHKKNVVPCKLVDRKQLQARDSGRQTILVKLDTGRQIKYEAGDNLAICAPNREDIVDKVFDKIVEKYAETQALRVETKHIDPNGHESWVLHRDFPDVTLRQALTWCLDLTTPPTQEFLRMLQTQATGESDQQKILALTQNSKAYKEWKETNLPNIAELLEEWPSLRPSCVFVMSQLPTLQPRYYSISSSSKVNPNEIHATIGVVRYKTQGAKQSIHDGVCSSWMNTADIKETIPCYIRSVQSFHLPDDRSNPIILVGAGTGIAPFRSFWQQRQAERGSSGSMEIYFGCRKDSHDNIYKAELEQAKAQGIIQNVYYAFSREADKPKTYVQELILKNGESVYNTIMQNNGHLYICGGSQMAHEVVEAVRKIIQDCGNLSESEAKETVKRLKSDGFIREDIFGTWIKLPDA